MSKPGTPGTSTPSNTLLLRRQLTELTKHPVEGFSAGMHLFQSLYDTTSSRGRTNDLFLRELHLELLETVNLLLHL